ncbi:shikimate dehydrogenase [Conexibacter sp. S30A1]|uniref:shikimate dehydrogenase family protein n=1 Tax=Conexibacter sp. S30A1 TaxID=2937800 RepID=UPI00200C3CC7|nr:shikimate dehydrogenase [Conexibacter sp. S30A1]
MSEQPLTSPRSAALRRLGVVGWPVAHSLSPLIQNAALRDAGLGESWRYQLLPVPPGLFSQTLPVLGRTGFRGVNVTIPHKPAALALADSASASAAGSGAANALLFAPDGSLQAENTDAPALIAALAARVELRGASVVVLGAGGTARTAVWALTQAGAAEVSVWNRTRSRTSELVRTFGASVLATVPSGGEILINCTAAGLDGGDQLAALGLSAAAVADWEVVVDYVYRPGGTPLASAAAAASRRCVDGLELLIRQGALSFELFTGADAGRALAAMRAAVAICSAP